MSNKAGNETPQKSEMIRTKNDPALHKKIGRGVSQCQERQSQSSVRFAKMELNIALKASISAHAAIATQDHAVG